MHPILCRSVLPHGPSQTYLYAVSRTHHRSPTAPSSEPPMCRPLSAVQHPDTGLWQQAPTRHCGIAAAFFTHDKVSDVPHHQCDACCQTLGASRTCHRQPVEMLSETLYPLRHGISLKDGAIYGIQRILELNIRMSEPRDRLWSSATGLVEALRWSAPTIFCTTETVGGKSAVHTYRTRTPVINRLLPTRRPLSLTASTRRRRRPSYAPCCCRQQCATETRHWTYSCG